jgi:hypothetical protein
MALSFSKGVRAMFAAFKRYIPDDDPELKSLDLSARLVIIYLVAIRFTSFLLGAFFLSGLGDAHLPKIVQDVRTGKFLGQVLIGVSGSAVAALGSCLTRFANGFERYNGDPYPPPKATDDKDKEKEKGKFSGRFAYWLLARPYLGAPVAPVFIWGLSHFTNNHQEFTTSNRLVGFTAFMAGLLAKSVLELVKGLFKNVFKS